MDKKEVLRQKYQLVKSEEWKLIKYFMFENIKTLSNSEIDPLILKGMIKTIYDTDKWETVYLSEIKED